jgi:ferredoxin
MTEKFLKKESLDDLIGSVRSAGGRFVAPGIDARQVVYMEIAEAGEIDWEYIIPKNTYKEWVFPQTEVVSRFELTEGGVELEEAVINPAETVVFGARPCEAASLASLRAVFTWDFIDEFYTRREDTLTVLTIACTRADDECFCTTVDLSPESTDGSDVILKETPKGDYVASAVTEKGEAFFKAHSKVFVALPKKAETKKLVMPDKIEGVDTKRMEEWLSNPANYASPVWGEMARKCIGCGACTFSCPTCHCFDITDEGDAFSGERRKNWDACQFDHFTLHASGHNPRDTQFKRYRNRFMCKFNFYPKKFNSIGCVGCGRCIRVCPVRLDITELMEATSKAPDVKPGS